MSLGRGLGTETPVQTYKLSTPLKETAVLLGALFAGISAAALSLDAMRLAPSQGFGSTRPLFGASAALILFALALLYLLRYMKTSAIVVAGDHIEYRAGRKSRAHAFSKVVDLRRYSLNGGYYEVRFSDGKKIDFMADIDGALRLASSIEAKTGKRFR